MVKLIKGNIPIALGPFVFFFLQLNGPFGGMSPQALAVLSTTSWMGIWWVFEIIPISVTALLPIVLFPLTGGLDLASTAAAYGHKYIFLYMGGFMIAIAIEKWNLHKRIALNIIDFVGTDMNRIVLGFMLATAFLSMWISNTATAVMMLPIGVSIVKVLIDNPNTIENETKIFGKMLMLSIAYSASIGGLATLVGTPPNLVLAGVISEVYGIEISFTQWFILGLPISIMLLLVGWIFLTRYAFQLELKTFPGGRDEILRIKKDLGPIRYEEKWVAYLFAITAFCWISRTYLIQPFLPEIDDTIIAMIFGISLFLIPSSDKQQKILLWDEAVKMPWGIILLFGGGMALARGFEFSGLAKWMGDQIIFIQNLPLLIMLLIVITFVNFLTEITSNLATTAMILPILASIAIQLDVHPYSLLVGAAIAASCAFMLPVATPPNAVVFGSGYLKISDMVKRGFVLNIFSIGLILVVIYFLLPLLWDFDPSRFPLKFKL